MKVAITGAGGNVGTALLRAMRGEDWEPVGIARRRPDTTREPYTLTRWVTCDIGEAAAIPVLTEAFADADAVVHLAWAIHPRREDPPMARTNAVGSAHVMYAAAAAGVPQLVCASSAAAYAPAERWRRIDESWALTGVPGSAYSLGKALLEQQLDAFERQHPAMRIARIRPCGIVQGAAAAQLAGWLFGSWLPRPLLGRRWVPVPLWKDLRLQLVHADDVASAIRLILRQQAEGAFNLAADPALSAQALAASFGGFRVPLSRRVAAAGVWAGWRSGLLPLHPGWITLADRACLLDTGRARGELGWVPHYDAGAVCDELVAALRAGRVGDSGPLTPTHTPFRPGRPTHQSQDPDVRQVGATAVSAAGRETGNSGGFPER
ncbi:NAD-dependent epimerase/dehydratase family protein [Nocardia paucivorans]|uniref:NAD-dependent epimerase/dehydratase family protein n=1 Tax=Nocardia paucivorans TaxID=114259 RepID=UPI0002F13641|nr:NAD-dependent epimerase/dehydratase family protein [Nocardia paucivorans]